MGTLWFWENLLKLYNGRIKLVVDPAPIHYIIAINIKRIEPRRNMLRDRQE
jgi:hypothetical protein